MNHLVQVLIHSRAVARILLLILLHSCQALVGLHGAASRCMLTRLVLNRHVLLVRVVLTLLHLLLLELLLSEVRVSHVSSKA